MNHIVLVGRMGSGLADVALALTKEMPQARYVNVAGLRCKPELRLDRAYARRKPMDLHLTREDLAAKPHATSMTLEVMRTMPLADICYNTQSSPPEDIAKHILIHSGN